MTTMNNVREKMANARNLCKGMSEEIYAFTDYISEVANDTLAPQGLVLCYFLAMDDIEKGRNGFAAAKSTKLPSYLVQHKNMVLSQAVYFPQIVDELADEAFAEEFRDICKMTLGIDPPKRVKAEVDAKYPEFVRIAVDWWANAVAAPKLDNGEELPSFIGAMAAKSVKPQSEEGVKAFKETLAEEIIAAIESSGSCYLSVDYHPCAALAKAGEKLGLNPMMGYPWKTSMNITEKEVRVKAGYGAGSQILWFA